MAAEAYKKQQILTATPEALTLMLYNGALRFMTEGIDALKVKNYEQANTAIQRAENIISEFQVTLKMEYDIAKQLMPLYEYVNACLFMGNMQSNIEKIEEAKHIITELRDAWAVAMKEARKEKSKTT